MQLDVDFDADRVFSVPERHAVVSTDECGRRFVRRLIKFPASQLVLEFPLLIEGDEKVDIPHGAHVRFWVIPERRRDSFEQQGTTPSGLRSVEYLQQHIQFFCGQQPGGEISRSYGGLNARVYDVTGCCNVRQYGAETGLQGEVDLRRAQIANVNLCVAE